MSVNANAPNVLGHEVMVLRQRGLKFTKDQRRAGIITPPAVLTDDIAVRLSNVVGNPTVLAEIIPVSAITPANAVVTIDTYRPSADKVMTEARHAGGGTVAPFYVDIDDPGVPDTSDWIGNTAASGSSSFGYNVAAALAGGRRPLVVTLHFVMSTVVVLQTGTYGFPFVFTGTKFVLDPIYVTAQQQYDVPLLMNPANGLPWTAADVNAFASSSYFGVDAGNSSAGSFRLFDSWMTVDHVAETRLASGSAVVTADGWAILSMTSPLNVDTWLPGATPYAIILSCAGSGSASWNAVDAGVAHPDISSAPVTITSAGFPSALGTTDTAAPAVVGVDGAGVPLWGQPMSLAIPEAVYTGRVLQQELTLPDSGGGASQDRGSVGLVVWQQSALTTLPLVARLKRRSDNVQIGGDVTINPINVRGKPRIPQVVRLPMLTAATALTAVQVYVEITCAAASGAGWNVMTVSAEVAAYAALGFGGSTDIPTIAGVDKPEREIPLQLGLARNPVTVFAVVAA